MGRSTLTKLIANLLLVSLIWTPAAAIAQQAPSDTPSHVQGDQPPLPEPAQPGAIPSDVPRSAPQQPGQPQPGQLQPGQLQSGQVLTPPPAVGLPGAGAGNPVDDAEMDADAEVSGALWFVLGCGLNVWGLLLAWIADSPLPYGRLAGKSPAYSQTYVMAFRRAATSVRTRYALYGCATLVGVYALVAITAVQSSGGIE